MKKQRTWPYFLMALCFAFFTSHLPLLFFSPFYAILYRRTKIITTLWFSAGCGLFLDLRSAELFGTQTFIAIALSLFLHRQHTYFVDKPIGLFSYTLIISIFLTVLNRLFYFIYHPTFSLTLKGFTTDFLILPVADAFYGLFFFSYPPIVYRFLKKQRFRFPFLKKNSRRRKEESVHGA